MASTFVDAATQDSLTDVQAKFFHDKGYLVVKNMLSAEELEILRSETQTIIQQRNVGPDFWYNDDIPGDWYNNYKESGHKDNTQTNTTSSEGSDKKPSQEETTELKRGVPFRVEYVVDKMESCKNLIAHPFLLKCIARLQGPDFLPTWDSLVFKYEGDGVPIKWHRDASSESIGGGFYNFGSKKTADGTYHPPIDAGVSIFSFHYPANTKLGNCLWAIPGSHFWDDSLASSMISHFTTNGFRTAGAVPIEVEPGDMIMHNILILHGSSSCKSPLRRTVYYEFRTAEAERNVGPHIPAYIPLKQKMLADCIENRKSQYPTETYFNYMHTPSDQANPPTSFRFSHDDYFSKNYKG